MKGINTVAMATFATALCMIAAVDAAPDCPLTADNETLLLPNAENCSTFYLCTFGKPVAFDCPVDLLYCSEKAQCSYYYDENCTFSDCIQQTPHELRLADVPDCPFLRPDETLLLPNADDCSHFYQCKPLGVAVPFACPNGTLYCSENGACAYPYDENCTFSDCIIPTPHELRIAPDCPLTADNETLLLPNAENCSTFYLCTFGKPVAFDCPIDLLYCSEKAQCSYYYDENCTFSDCIQQTPHELRLADVPDCPFLRPDETLLLPNADDCSHFYQCKPLGVAVPFACPNGTLYCSENGACAYPYDENCTFSDCIIPTPHELRIAPDCPLTADNETLLLPNAENCSTFYLCTFGKPVAFDCPVDLLYCSEKAQCSYYYDENCTFSDCIQQTPHELRLADAPTCPSVKPDETLLLPDANDCSHFYQCKPLGIAVPFACPNGTLYCSENGACAYPYDENCTFSDCIIPTPHELRIAPDCPLTADNETLLLPNAENCSTFYLCTFGKPVAFDCPIDLLYCSEKAQCSYYYDENCTFSDCIQQTPHELRLADVPDCPFLRPDETLLLPNADDCSHFYQCKPLGVAVPFACPNGTLYCSENGACAYPYDENCTFSDCIIPTPHELRIAPDCPLTADNETLLLPNAENCSTFYLCTFGKPVAFDCPIDLLYCSEKAQCSYYYDENCTFSDCIQQTPHELRLADVPDCPFLRPDETLLLPNADDCSHFYQCKPLGVAVPFACPNGTLYCSENGACAYPYDENCTFSDCIIPTPHELRIAPDCPLTADNETLLLPNAENCSTFYLCTFGKPVAFDCPVDLLYCSEKAQCSYYYDENCTFSDCIQQTPHELRLADAPTCPSVKPDETLLLPDANDCSHFYQCKPLGIAVPFACPNGTLYCSENGACAYPYDENCTFSDCIIPTPHELRIAPDCPLTADNETLLLPNAENCSTFYLCTFGKPVAFDCPVELLYCSEKAQCSYYYDENCTYSDCIQQPSINVIHLD